MDANKKYRILSVDAEKLVHSQLVGGFSALEDGKPDLELFSGVFDYSLESEKLKEICDASRNMSRKTFFEAKGYGYTTAVINVKFVYTRHEFVKMNGVFVRGGFAVSEAFADCAEVRESECGEKILVAIKVGQPLEGIPLSDEILGKYFKYDPKENQYVRRKAHGIVVPFDMVEDKKSLRQRLYRDGFDCDGVHYVRYKRSAGSSRTGQCLFIAEPLYDKMMKWSLCGLDLKNRDSIDLASFEAYVSLSLSSITDKLCIPKESILFMKDAKSTFKTHAVSVELGEDGRLVPNEQEVEVTNAIWDGEALLDTSVFAEAGYANRGMMLLRNRFFKTCAFNTNLQQYFADNNISEVSQLCGYTQAKSISDVKLVVTESSLKYLKLSSKKGFEKKIEAWLKNVGDVFGIVKTDKPTGLFGGRIVQTSYQLLNTLGLSSDETGELLKDTFDYYDKVRSSPMYMRNYINYILSGDDEYDHEDTDYFNARQNAVLGCLSRNDGFADTLQYNEFRERVLGSFSRKIKSGKLLVQGTNATIFGNGLEMLAASVGLFKEGYRALALGGEGKIYCKHFADGAELLGCRSPHVTMGNLMVAENVIHEEINKYFNLTDEIVYVNAIECNIQQRLNGCDYDSDAMLLTDNSLMVKAAKRNNPFSVPVCSIDSTRKNYADTPEGKAELDHEISQNKIGEIINLSQILNSLYWHNTVNSPNDTETNEALYRDICVLAVLSGMEIDKAKRNYDVVSASVIARMKKKHKVDKLPNFFYFIINTMKKKKRATRSVKSADELMSYDTTMDYIYSQTLAFTKSRSKLKHKNLPLKHFMKAFEKKGDRIKSGKNDARQCEVIKKYVANCQDRIVELRVGLHDLETDEKYLRLEEIEQVYREAVEYVGDKLQNYYILKSLLLDIDCIFAEGSSEEKKFAWILFEMLCFEKNHLLYSVFSESRDEDMYDIVLGDGDVEIYGVKHLREMAKNAKI